MQKEAKHPRGEIPLCLKQGLQMSLQSVTRYETPSFCLLLQIHVKDGRRNSNSSLLCVLQFHTCLSQQQSMLQDYQRTATYHKAILVNETDFRDKVTTH